MTMGEEEAEYGLVMPFVVCKDDGGRYDDESFVAGYRCCEIDMTLRFMAPISNTLEWYVEPGLLPQLDLIAMRHGWTMTSEPWGDHPDEWTRVSFEKALAQGGDEASAERNE